MTGFVDKLKLKEQAEEDTWFARRDRELLDSLHRRPRLLKIVSGGQTGVDRAALDAALDLGLAVGGWCPAGRKAEDGAIIGRYPLTETPTGDYAQRTEWNVRDSDGTLILYRKSLTGGSARTAEHAVHYERPLLVLDLTTNPDPAAAIDWLHRHGVRVLNCAGPRESGAPGIYKEARAWLGGLLSALAVGPTSSENATRA
jgi:predicted Rossmann fold nucleotide-binding protein DprA/Smf involved in DNA uptake